MAWVVRAAAQGKPLPDARVVQLGDLGAYAAKPGSKACFALASQFLKCGATLTRATLSRDPPPSLAPPAAPAARPARIAPGLTPRLR